jgi:hypothetical protein
MKMSPLDFPKPIKCAGCEKPFNLVRKPRGYLQHAFLTFKPANGANHALSPAAALCGACKTQMKLHQAGGFGAPEMPAGIVRLANEAEALFYAAPEGAPQ